MRINLYLHIFISLALIIISTIAFGQARTVTGQVSSSDGETLPGVNILIEGTTSGTTTDFDGNYSIQVQSSDAVLIFTFIGFKSQRVVVGNQTTINVTMEEDIQQLEEIVVVGYGTVKKSDLTGSVSKVKGDDLLKVPSSNPMQALQGKVAGVSVASASGEPGSDPVVRVRGVGTLNNANPIFVVDGIILNDVSFLSSNDIESIEVLKDASATAIYGSRGANGVFIVTTKSGKAGEKAQINFKAEGGVQVLQRKIDLLDTREFANAVNEINPGTFNNIDALPQVDWQDLIFEGNPMIQSYDLGIAGGSENASIYFGTGVFNQKGLIPKSEFTRYSLKLNASFKANEVLTVGANISAAYFDDDGAPGVVFTAYGAWPTDAPYVSPYLLERPPPPLDPIADTLFAEIRGTSNALGAIEIANNNSRRYRFISNFFAEFNFLESFRFRTSYQPDFQYGKTRSFTPEYFISALQQSDEDRFSLRITEDRSWIWENTLSFNKEFESHRVSAVAGLTMQRDFRESPTFQIRNLIRTGEDFLYLNTGLSDSARVNLGAGDLFQASLVSYLFRTNYSYDDRFLFTGSIRVDGSSKFKKDQRYGTFPSFALGWNISNEDFFPDIASIDNVKLRGSWGVIGNEKISVLSRFSVINNSATAVFGLNGTLATGSTLGSPGNEDLKWEETQQTNFGLEVIMMEGRLTSEIDYYNKKTEDILVDLSAPGYLGYGNFVRVTFNAASVRNSGLEFNFDWQDQVGIVDYRINFTGTTIRNEVLSLGATTEADSVIRDGPILGNNVTVTTPGQPIGSFTGYDVIGIYQNQNDLNQYPTYFGAGIGDLIYRDANGDGVVNVDDRVVIGSPIPDFIYGFSLQAGMKGFNLALDFQGQMGNQIYNGKNQTRFSLLNFEGRVRDRWTGEGTSTTEPRLTNAAGNLPPSEYYIEDGDFLRLRTITLSYEFPEQINESLNINKLTVYLRGTNVFTLTKYSGYSPEIGADNPLASGIDRGIFPVSSVYMGGVTLSF